MMDDGISVNRSGGYSEDRKECNAAPGCGTKIEWKKWSKKCVQYVYKSIGRPDVGGGGLGLGGREL